MYRHFGLFVVISEHTNCTEVRMERWKNGDRLRRARTARNLSLRGVEERGGPSKDTLSLAERGVHKPNTQTLSRTAAALDMSLDELLAELGEQAPPVPATPLSGLAVEAIDAQLWSLKTEAAAWELADAIGGELDALRTWLARYAELPSAARFDARQEAEQVKRNLALASMYYTAAMDHWSKLFDPRDATRKGVRETAEEVISAQQDMREVTREQVERKRIEQGRKKAG
jgi:transcriptional regulator with XRE-family HTH domain